VGRHVRHVDPQLDASVGRCFDREGVVNVARRGVVDRDDVQVGAVAPPRLARRQRASIDASEQPRQRPLLLLRVAARLDAKVELVGFELGGVLADRAEQLDQRRLPLVGRRQRRHLCESVALARLCLRGGLHAHDHALPAREEEGSRHAILAVAVAVVEAQHREAVRYRHRR